MSLSVGRLNGKAAPAKAMARPDLFRCATTGRALGYWRSRISDRLLFFLLTLVTCTFIVMALMTKSGVELSGVE